MTPAYAHLVRTSHVLERFANDPDPERLAQAFGTASGGEQIMIRAALSLIPAGWLEGEAAELAAGFRLVDVGSLDRGNARALVEAIAIACGYPDAVGADVV